MGAAGAAAAVGLPLSATVAGQWGLGSALASLTAGLFVVTVGHGPTCNKQSLSGLSDNKKNII